MNRYLRCSAGALVGALISGCAPAPVMNTSMAVSPEYSSTAIPAKPAVNEPVEIMVEPVYAEPPAEVIVLDRPSPIESVPVQPTAPKPEIAKALEKKPELVLVRRQPTPAPTPAQEPKTEIPVIVIESKPALPPLVDESVAVDLLKMNSIEDIEGDTDVMPKITEPEEVTPDFPMEEDLQTAMLAPEVAEPKASISSAEVPKLGLESLPVSFANQWSVDRRNNPLTGKTECILTSKSLTISDGYDNTSVQLLVTSGALYAKTRSTIDLTYPETGVRVDAGTLVAFNNVVGETSAVISGGAGSVYDRMTTGSSVKVRLGFWPTWPVTETREASFPLGGFADARAALQACDEM